MLLLSTKPKRSHFIQSYQSAEMVHLCDQTPLLIDCQTFFCILNKKYGAWCVNDVYKGVYVDLFINGTVSECIFNTNLKHI